MLLSPLGWLPPNPICRASRDIRAQDFEHSHSSHESCASPRLGAVHSTTWAPSRHSAASKSQASAEVRYDVLTSYCPFAPRDLLAPTCSSPIEYTCVEPAAGRAAWLCDIARTHERTSASHFSQCLLFSFMSYGQSLWEIWLTA